MASVLTHNPQHNVRVLQLDVPQQREDVVYDLLPIQLVYCPLNARQDVAHQLQIVRVLLVDQFHLRQDHAADGDLVQVLGDVREGLQGCTLRNNWTGNVFQRDELVKCQSGIEPGSSELIEVKGSLNSWVSTIFFDNRDLWKKCFLYYKYL